MSFTSENLLGYPNRVRRVFELVGGNFGRKAHGAEHHVLCLQHNDHNPSLDINLQKAVFLCRPCADVGDAIFYYRRALRLASDEDAIAELRSEQFLSQTYPAGTDAGGRKN